MNIDFMEAFKIIGLSSLIGLVVGYIFNRRLAKLKGTLSLNEKLMASVVDGAAEYIAHFRQTKTSLRLVGEKLANNQAAVSEISAFRESLREFRNTINTQRIYLIWFLPVDCSNFASGESDFLHADMQISQFGDAVPDHDSLERFTETIENAEKKYKIMSNLVVELLTSVQNGKPVSPRKVTDHDYPHLENAANWLRDRNLLSNREVPYIKM